MNRLVGSGLSDVVVQTGPARGIHLLADLQTEKHYWVGQREPHVLDAIVKYARHGCTVWDIGAHIGFTAFVAARCVGAEGRVYAFEPAPENRERLAEGVRLNGLRNIEVRSEAVGERSGVAILAPGATSLEWSLDETGHDSRRGIPVSVVTLNSLFDALPAPDLIKIDVEGAELGILVGGAMALLQHEPVLIVEFMAPEMVDEARGLLPGFQFSLLGANHWLLTVPGRRAVVRA